MRRILPFLIGVLGCSSSERSDMFSTHVSCDEKRDWLCCQTDNATAPSCVQGEWYCPTGFPNFVSSSQCTYPSESGCIGSAAAVECSTGTAGRACASDSFPRVCRDHTWFCPEGTVPRSECGCAAGASDAGVVRMPGDICTTTDAGADG